MTQVGPLEKERAERHEAPIFASPNFVKLRESLQKIARRALAKMMDYLECIAFFWKLYATIRISMLMLTFV